MSGDILIVAEHLEGRLAPSSFEIVSLELRTVQVDCYAYCVVLS